jgi:hypothetical protein
MLDCLAQTQSAEPRLRGDVCSWHFASLRGNAHFGRFRSEADINLLGGCFRSGMHSRDHIGGFDHAGCGDFKLDLGRHLIIGQALS